MSKKLLPKQAAKLPKPPKPHQSQQLFQPVQRRWPGETFVIIASGPSLTKADCDYVCGKARVIAVNTSVLLAPWADVLYACDARWWKWAHENPKTYPGVKDFPGLKFALTKDSRPWCGGVQVLQNAGSDGLHLKPNGLKTGRNSGYQAMNLAVHLGPPRRILLLGFDMQRTGGKEHWHADHPNATRSPYGSFRKSFQTIVEPLRKLGIEVVNCSRATALDCFPRMTIEDALPESDNVRLALPCGRAGAVDSAQPDMVSMA